MDLVSWPFPSMPTYIYETVPKKTGARPKRFEVKQSMNDNPLTKHPETGETVRRVIAGGYGFIAQKSAPPPSPCCGGGGDCNNCECNN
jgi:predicted nucleic acid-binding Zn ribbon protein